MKDQLALESPPARRHGTDQPRHHTKPTTQQHNSTSNRAHTNYHEKSGLELVDDTEEPGVALAEIRDQGADAAIAVLSDVAELAASSLVQLHGTDEVRATLNRLIVADLEEEANILEP